MMSRLWLESGVEPPSQSEADPFSSITPPAPAADLTWENAAQNLKLEFVWSPMVNGNMTRALERWAKGKFSLCFTSRPKDLTYGKTV